MPNIQVRPVRDLRNKFGEIESLLSKHDPVIITKNGRGEAAIINFDDYKEYEKYLYDKYALDKLKEAEDEVARGQAKWHSAEDVIKELRNKYNA